MANTASTDIGAMQAGATGNTAVHDIGAMQALPPPVVITPPTLELTLGTAAPAIFPITGMATKALSLTPQTPAVTVDVRVITTTKALTLSPQTPTVSVLPTPVVTATAWDTAVTFEPGDEWIVTLSGPDADAPEIRLSLEFEDLP